MSEPHQTCFLAKLQDFEEERFQCLQVDEPKLVDRREVGMTFSKLACMVTFDHEKLEVYQLAVE